MRLKPHLAHAMRNTICVVRVGPHRLTRCACDKTLACMVAGTLECQSTNQQQFTVVAFTNALGFVAAAHVLGCFPMRFGATNPHVSTQAACARCSAKAATLCPPSETQPLTLTLTLTQSKEATQQCQVFGGVIISSHARALPTGPAPPQVEGSPSAENERVHCERGQTRRLA